MIYKSKRYKPRPKARDVLLTWAQASAYKDEAVEYLELPDLAHDRSIQKRLIAIARHYWTLAEIERLRETSPQNPQSQGTIEEIRSRSLTSFAFVLFIVVSGATTIAPFDLGHASDCLPAPNSPAPKGSHWYYHLNRSTQQKCWYVRSSEKQPQRATAQSSSADAAVPSTSAGQTGSSAAHNVDGSSGQVEPPTNEIHDPASNTVPNGSASQAAPQENMQPPAPQENASYDARSHATAPTPVIWPDPPPMAPSVIAREANAAAVNAPVDPVSDTADSVARNGERTSTFEIPIIIFPALAIGLVVIGFGARIVIKDSTARRAQTVDHTEAATISYENHAESLSQSRCG